MSDSGISTPSTFAGDAPPVPLLASLRTQVRVIGALLMREIITRYGRHNIGFMWLFVEPMMFTGGVLIMWTALGLHKTALPIVPFTLTGYGTVVLWRNTIGRCSNAVGPNRALMHHRNVRVIDLFISRIILEIMGATMSFIILALALGAVGFVPMPDDPFKMASAWILLTWFSTGMAAIIGSLSALNEVVDRIWHVASYLFLPISGAFTMINWVPPKFQAVLLWIPIANCVELFREGLLGININARYDIFYVAVFNLIITLLGLLLIRYVARHLEDA
jgi:capsular polysaccharide transport system permease protein